MNDYSICTRSLGRRFGSIQALEDMNLNVSRGTILSLLGPNGAGKTTLLRILMGLIDPTSGQAFVLGDATCRCARVAGRVAYVGDRCEPPTWASAGMLETMQAGASPRFDRGLFRTLCNRGGVESSRPYGSCSKGQRKWVLTSLALASGPELILLDEPADGLDPSARRSLYDSLRDYVNDREATAVVATHIIADVERIADEVAIIEAGRLVLHSPLDDLRERVRQVEIPGQCAPPELGELGQVWGQTQLKDMTIAWVSGEGLDNKSIRRRLGIDVTIRTVGLETLYLAIAEHGLAAKLQLERKAV